MTDRDQGQTLIPPSEVVRTELARCAREYRRLQSLLRIALKAEEDREFVAAFRARFSGAEPCTETTTHDTDRQ